MPPTLSQRESVPSDPDAGECRELLRRILASQTFAKSERLSSFLTYIANLTLEGRAGELNEQKIGEAVFSRRPGYDSAADGIVRTQATRLRQRLDLYFRTEGANETLRVSVPRGGYVPIFEYSEREPAAGPAPVEIPPVSPTSDPAPPPAAAAARPWRWSALWTAAAVAVIVCSAFLLYSHGLVPPQARAATVPHPLWSQMFNRHQPTLVIPGDSSLVIWEGLTNRNMDLATYLSGDYRDVLPGSDNPMRNLAARLANRRYTSIVDLEIAQALGRMALTAGGTVETRYARDVRPNDLKNGNAVLIGDTEANPWVSLFEQNMNFVFSYDRARHISSVVNRSPRGSEAHRWDFVGADKQHRVYAVVAYVSNLSGDGNVLILEGTSMAGTECAWDFTSDDTQLLPFLRHIQRPDGTIPHFEVVLGSNNMSGSSVRATILAWRIDH